MLNKTVYHSGMVLVIDEAHLLFSDDLAEAQRPSETEIEEIKEAIKAAWLETNSTKKGPLRVILLTGTPVQNDPTTFFKLMNLIRPKSLDVLPETLDGIKDRYGPDPFFRHDKSEAYKKLHNDVSGFISYLDTQFDSSIFARQSNVIVHEVPISMSEHSVDKNKTTYKNDVAALSKAQTRLNTVSLRIAKQKEDAPHPVEIEHLQNAAASYLAARESRQKSWLEWRRNRTHKKDLSQEFFLSEACNLIRSPRVKHKATTEAQLIDEMETEMKTEMETEDQEE
jgi:SNF2 family DNA or RNA helicase